MAQTVHGSPRGCANQGGFTLVELIIVVMVLGVLAAVVATGVAGFRQRTEDAGCANDNRILVTAIEAYRAEFSVTAIPAADATVDGSERTLVNAGFLRAPSELHNIDAGGDLVVAAGAQC